jgi:two-component system, cell cycle sensor histidine kinase and response regulator CckA
VIRWETGKKSVGQVVTVGGPEGGVDLPLLFEDHPCPMWVFDPDTLGFLAVNRAAVSLYGFSEDEFLSMSLLDVRPLDQQAFFRAHYQRDLTPDLPYEIITHWKKDGTLLRVRLHASDVRYRGRDARMVVVQDVTEEEKARAALEDAQQAAHLGSWTVELQPPGKVTGSLEGFRVLGVPPDAKLTVHDLYALVHPDDRARVYAAGAAAVSRGERYDLEFRLVRPDGQLRWLHQRGRVVRDAHGKPLWMVGMVQDVTDRQRAEDDRDRLFALAGDLLCIVDADGKIERVNPAFERALGYPEGELRGRPALDMLDPDDLDTVHGAQPGGHHGPRAWRGEARCRTKDGATRRFMWSVVHVLETGHYYASGHDVTEQRALEERLLQAQKLEAVGRIAGGVAHDFNNLLSVILSTAHFLQQDLPGGTRQQTDVEDILAAARRGATLTRQLLAFSSRQVMKPRVLDLNELIRDAHKMLGRVTGSSIEYVLALSDRLGAIRADAGHLEQVLVNLVVNARDAMRAGAGGGKLTIETANLAVAPGATIGPVAIPPGCYVRLSVSDNGVGMDEPTLRRAFEPFFTTKPPGKGSGLGLSTVFGIVNQSGGYIWAESEPGKGSRFTICFPMTTEEPAVPVPEPDAGAASGDETVLVVDDDADVRHLACRTLERCGYTVIEAANAGEALLAIEEVHGIDLLLTDVVMPRMNGRQLADRVRARHPGIRVLYMSGHPGDERPSVDADLVEKPLIPETLARRVRDTLGEAAL